jgi:hypothetical protein
MPGLVLKRTLEKSVWSGLNWRRKMNAVMFLRVHFCSSLAGTIFSRWTLPRAHPVAIQGRSSFVRELFLGPCETHLCSIPIPIHEVEQPRLETRYQMDITLQSALCGVGYQSPSSCVHNI